MQVRVHATQREAETPLYFPGQKLSSDPGGLAWGGGDAGSVR